MQDYQMFMRAVWGGQTIFNDPAKTDLWVQNYGEALSQLREVYLRSGYEVLSVDYLGVVDTDPNIAPNSPKAQLFAWHLVKEVDEGKKSKGDT